jgi:hypothetical protein
VILERAMVETLGNVRRLLLNGDEDVAGFVVKALLRVVVANVLDGIADDFLVVELGLGRDLAKDHDHARLGSRLAGDLRRGVLFKAGIELDSTLDINYNHHILQRLTMASETWSQILSRVSFETNDKPIWGSYTYQGDLHRLTLR